MADIVTVELPYGRKRALEIATTLAMEPQLMLLDEPTQGMGHEDVDRVTAADQEGVGQSHRADGRAQHERGGQASPTSSRVLQRGQVIAEGPYETVSKNPQVLEAYMGSADAGLQGAHG